MGCSIYDTFGRRFG
uniref:Uncharacterized protein n=1 Tax=Arundo donax TaxID=35708 RepID=A0A0A8YYL5_ARUDO